MFTQSALMAEAGKLQKFSMKLTRNKSDVDDLFQSTCVRAIEKWHYFEEGSNLFSWTTKIMFNIFVSNYRRKARFETQYDPDLDHTKANGLSNTRNFLGIFKCKKSNDEAQPRLPGYPYIDMH